jgi:hypothetical protein
MDRFAPRPRRPRPARPTHLGEGPAQRRAASTWPGITVVVLLVVTGAILLFNQQHSGDPLKVRRELRKF